MALNREARRDLIDIVMTKARNWSGQLDEVAFLSRLVDLSELGSRDHRFKTAERDIWQHRINNPDDWSDDWVFHDTRFDLARSDDALLGFLCEMLHPLVRPNQEERDDLAEAFNEILRPEGWELVRGRKRVSGAAVYVARPVADDRRGLADAAEDIALKLDSVYVSRQIRRMEAAIDDDPDLAVGTAKEFIETVAKSILDERDVDYDQEDASVTALVRAVAEELDLVPDRISDKQPAARSVKRVLGSLAGTAQGLAEIRNTLGTGHGKKATTSPLRSRHAQLAVGAAITLGTFLYQTHDERD